MRRIRITGEVKPHVYKGKIDEVVHDRFVLERLAFAQTHGTEVVWDIDKPSDFDALVEQQKT